MYRFLTVLWAMSALPVVAQQTTTVLSEIIISIKPEPLVVDFLPASVGRVTTINLDGESAQKRGIDQVLVDEGAAAWDAANSLGIANGLSVRGFVVNNQGVNSLQVGRNFLNGHADLVWRFARDPATVQRVDLVSGSDATLLGAGSPAASILYTSKIPEGVEAKKIGLTLGDHGLRRLVGDVELHWLGVQTRSVIALQRGDKGIEGVKDERNVLLLSNKVAVGAGAVRLDVEYHQNTTPFAFGTAYVNGKFLYDQSYVDPRASADRQYYRHAMYLDHPLGAAAQINVYWQRAKSSRDELLLGFFDPLNASKLRGYYRLIDEKNTQSDFGVKLNGQLKTGPVTHQWAAAWQHLGLARNFTGPQNIGGFTLNIDNPEFPANLTSLALAPRYAFERYRERGVAITDVARLGAWDVRLGLRRSTYQLASSTSKSSPPAPVADASHTSSSAGLGYKIDNVQRLWVSRTESFLPNRGKLSGGAFLPPSISRQYELGWHYQKDKQSFSLALFDLQQSNLPAKDPNDPDALVLIGSNRSKGFEAKASLSWAGLQWQAALTRFHARVQDRVSPAQGGFLVGSPDGYGSLKVSLPLAAGIISWLRLQAATSRPGNDKATFRSPGYGVLSLGLTSAATNSGITWGASVQNVTDKRYVRSLTGADNVWQGPRRSAQFWVDTAF